MRAAARHIPHSRQMTRRTMLANFLRGSVVAFCAPQEALWFTRAELAAHEHTSSLSGAYLALRPSLSLTCAKAKVEMREKYVS
jgi:hypothetical protein